MTAGLVGQAATRTFVPTDAHRHLPPLGDLFILKTSATELVVKQRPAGGTFRLESLRWRCFDGADPSHFQRKLRRMRKVCQHIKTRKASLWIVLVAVKGNLFGTWGLE
ncbi:hypothetical protein LIA77_10478 [Sarocladium implicatum]|nr:hypothetical protein LIA77_10478 [Sarocladium implicatum]